MDSKLKQRLVGAVVLVALAVILVPMILESPEDLGEPGSNLPPMPEAIIREPAEPLVLPPPEVTVPAPPEGLAEAPVTAEPTTGVPAPARPVSESVAEENSAGTAPAPAVETSPVKPAAPATAPAATTSGTPPELTGWVVQLGSFSSKSNATALRDKARALGYAAFVQPAKTSKGTTYRVRVGPELERARAERLRDELKEKLGMAGMVTHHP